MHRSSTAGCASHIVSGAIVFSRAARPTEDSEYTYSGGIPVCLVKPSLANRLCKLPDAHR